MSQPPFDIVASVFARLPAALDLSTSGRHSAWLDDRPYHDARLGSFLEGPSFDRDGLLYCVDIAYGRILRIDPAGAVEVFVEYDGAPNGLKIHRDGRLFVADHKCGLMVIDPVSRAVSCLLAGAQGEPFKGLNDLVFAKNGDLYFTDQGHTGLQDPSGRLFRLTAAGRLELVLGGIPSPNGLVLTRDERSLLLAVTRANQVWRLPLGPDGHAYKVGVFLNLSGGGGPDGLALDAEDGLSVAQMSACNRIQATSPPGGSSPTLPSVAQRTATSSSPILRPAASSARRSTSPARSCSRIAESDGSPDIADLLLPMPPSAMSTRP
jgi:gluconolactonase